MRREELESLKWAVSKAIAPSDGAFDYSVYEADSRLIVGEFFGRVGPDDLRPSQTYASLAASAPELALACLDTLVEIKRQTDATPVRTRLEERLRTVLAAAGVEAKP